MYMEKGLDTGDMLISDEVEITDDDNFETLHDKLAEVGKNVLLKALKMLENGTAKREKQDDSKTCYAHMIDKQTAKIDFSKSVRDVFNLTRGLYPYPKAQTVYDGKMMKICVSKPTDEKSGGVFGEIMRVERNSFFVSCADCLLEVLKIQTEGKREMTVADYLKGNTIEKGKILGV